jgi:hypothetical protein
MRASPAARALLALEVIQGAPGIAGTFDKCNRHQFSCAGADGKFLP